MTRSQQELLRAYGIRPVKRRGQNFLVDGNLARAIAQDVVALGDRVLELGAGGGALTAHLLPAKQLAKRRLSRDADVAIDRPPLNGHEAPAKTCEVLNLATHRAKPVRVFRMSFRVLTSTDPKVDPA